MRKQRDSELTASQPQILNKKQKEIFFPYDTRWVPTEKVVV